MDYRQYENGVADVLSFLMMGEARVDRNVHLQGRLSGASRQIDILANGRIFNFTEANLVVDCKKWRTPVDVADVGSFLDLVEDVGAEFGLLMTASGASRAAVERAKRARGIRTEVLTIDELEKWRPPGTLDVALRINKSDEEAALKLLRRAGFRVNITELPAAEDRVVIEAIRHYGTDSPSGALQEQHLQTVTQHLKEAGIPGIIHSHGIVNQGGTQRIGGSRSN